jgi:putative oxidoreductase
MMKKFLVRCFLEWPDNLARHLTWLAPLFGRIVVGWIFLWRGWNDVHARSMNLDLGSWGASHAHLVAPLVSGIELAGGIFLLLGFISRFSAGLLSVVMILVLAMAHRGALHSVTGFVSLKETQYLALFLWVAVAGAGPFSLDNLIQRPAKAG